MEDEDYYVKCTKMLLYVDWLSLDSKDENARKIWISYKKHAW